MPARRGWGPALAIASIAMAMLVPIAACGRAEPRGSGAAIEITEATDAAGWAVEGGPRFGTVAVTGVRIEPATLQPGQAARLTLEITGLPSPVKARVALEPPRAGSRQVALGGVGAPPSNVPEDARVRAVDVELSEGEITIDLPALPQPWHPRRALVTLALEQGSARIPATAGPRRSDGSGVLALVPVHGEPARLDANRSDDAIAIDGVLDEPVWRGEGTSLVESLDGEPWDGPPTRVWAAWDDTALYMAAHVEDTDVWSDFERHDDPLWDAEVFEVFVFGDDDDRDYLELQVSPRGVTFDARFPQHRKADRAWTSRMVTAVRVDGNLDRRDDVDAGWVAEVAIPWDEICAETAASCPPRPGTTLRMNAFRFERPSSGGTVGLALSPTRVPDFHAARNAAILTLK